MNYREKPNLKFFATITCKVINNYKSRSRLTFMLPLGHKNGAATKKY